MNRAVRIAGAQGEAEQGALPEGTYEALTKLGTADLEQLAEAANQPVEQCAVDIGVLIDVGLVQDVEGKLNIVSPRAPMEAWTNRLEEQARAARQAALRLAEMYDAGTRPKDDQFVEVFHGAKEISAVFVSMQETAQAAIAVMVRGPFVTDGYRNNPELEALARGVRYRAVYDTSALLNSDMLSFTNEAIAAGEAARVFADLPVKLVLRDDNLGLLAMPANSRSEAAAMLVRPSMFLETLQALFEVFWRLGVPVSHAALGEESSAESWRADAAKLSALLAAGLTDEYIARQLGVSERTVQRRIARFQEMLGARNRFQLGAQAARQGWL